MSKKNSIIFQITVFFVTVFILINIIVTIHFFLEKSNEKALVEKRYMSATKIILDGRFDKLSSKEVNKRLKAFNVSLSNQNFELLKSLANKIVKDKFSPLEIIYYNSKKYIHLKPPRFKTKDEKFNDKSKNPILNLKDEPILFVDLLDENQIKYLWMIILFIIDTLLICFYYFLYKKLKPLIKLKDEISKFSNGNLNINTQVNGKDEISQVSNEFNNAIEKIRELNDSRKLFLRNILHELKTPITKGKLVSDTLEENKKKVILQRSFLRLEYLLGEFVKLEELTSGKMNLIKKDYRVVDLLDQALDILLISKSQVDIYSNMTIINVDYELFSIALKNLIDNSMKYNSYGKPEIIIKEDSLIVKNHGKPLKRTFEDYLKPFNREYESIDKGLGLGLYIINNIINRHGFKLYYNYNGDYHIFKIQFLVDKED